jgi:hypothetical protein
MNSIGTSPVVLKKNCNAKTQTPSDSYYMKEKSTSKKKSEKELPKEKPLSSYPVIPFKVKHPSPSYPD